MASDGFSSERFRLPSDGSWPLYLLLPSYPLVTSAAFEAWACYDFEGGRSFLKADVAVECGSAAHEHVVGWAMAALLLYPVGLFVLTAALLNRARRAIVHGPSTPLSRALAFLYAEHQPAYYAWGEAARILALYRTHRCTRTLPRAIVPCRAASSLAWDSDSPRTRAVPSPSSSAPGAELMEMLRRFVLVGVLVVVAPGTLLQIHLAIIGCIGYLTAQVCFRSLPIASDRFRSLPIASDRFWLLHDGTDARSALSRAG